MLSFFRFLFENEAIALKFEVHPVKAGSFVVLQAVPRPSQSILVSFED